MTKPDINDQESFSFISDICCGGHLSEDRSTIEKVYGYFTLKQPKNWRRANPMSDCSASTYTGVLSHIYIDLAILLHKPIFLRICICVLQACLTAWYPSCGNRREIMFVLSCSYRHSLVLRICKLDCGDKRRLVCSVSCRVPRVKT